MSEAKSYRYESPELKVFKKLTTDEQFKKVYGLTQGFEDKLEVIAVKDQSITVKLFVEKDKAYETLVEYETYIREKLDNIPIIVLIQERKDANKKRK